MDGLEKLINTIITDAENQAKQIKDKADLEAQQTILEASKKAEKITADILSSADVTAMNLVRTADSGANLDGRKAVLAARRKCINAVFEKAEEKLCNLPDSDYFDILIKIVKKTYNGGSAELILNKKDNARKTDVFLKELDSISGGAIKVSAECGEFKGGFILKYPTLEENCSFESILHTNREALEDTAARILFA